MHDEIEDGNVQITKATGVMLDDEPDTRGNLMMVAVTGMGIISLSGNVN